MTKGEMAKSVRPTCPKCGRAMVKKLRGAFKVAKCPTTGGEIKFYKAACYYKLCRAHFVLREVTPPQFQADSAIIEHSGSDEQL